MKKARILVQGIVQGVGFRPNVYRLAKALELNGYVRNLGNVVEIVVEGSKKDIITFSNDLKDKKPPISKIDSLKIEWLDDRTSQSLTVLIYWKAHLTFQDLQLYLLMLLPVIIVWKKL